MLCWERVTARVGGTGRASGTVGAADPGVDPDAAEPGSEPDSRDADAPVVDPPEGDPSAADPEGPVWRLDDMREVAEDPDGDRVEGPGDAADPSVEATWETSPCGPLAVGVEAAWCGSDPEEEPVVAEAVPPELLPVGFASSTRSCCTQSSGNTLVALVGESSIT